MFLVLKIYSKNKNSYKKILNFLKILTKKLKMFPIYVYKLDKKNKKKKFTVLKSPHVNKTAQEQFEIRKYESRLEIYSYSNIFLLFALKRITKMLYKDVNIKFKIFYDNLKFSKFLKSNYNTNSIYFTTTDRKFKNIKGYLKLLDCYGETCFHMSR